MKEITKEYIISELKTKRAISALYVFSLVGFIIPFIPFMVIKSLNTNSMISFIFLLIVFGLPFGYFIGLKNILSTIRIRSDLKKNNFYILNDIVVDMKISKNGRASDMDDSFCKLYLEKYSVDGATTVSVQSNIFKKLKIGDSCILVFCKSEKYPVLVFAGNDYYINKDLCNFIE